MNTLLKISLRQNALFIPSATQMGVEDKQKEATYALVANMAKLGFGVSEDLLHALFQVPPQYQEDILTTLRDVMGMDKNWTPLVKGWNIPTGEYMVDHIVTFFTNIFQAHGTRLACGHIIPDGTFPLERYNGCPFCGTPFVFGDIEEVGQGSKLKVLALWHETDIKTFFGDLLASKTALDATQRDSLKMLLATDLALPNVTIGMKETRMAVIETLIETNQADKAQAFFDSPNDILRYLWYKHTGFFQIVEPKTIIKRHTKNHKFRQPNVSHVNSSMQVQLSAFFTPMATKPVSEKVSTQEEMAKVYELKLKYGRKEGIIVARWLNNLAMPAEKAAEIMHPKRGMWVRFIRALRLTEYSQRADFENLRTLMDVFYNQTYPVWQGRVNHVRLRKDAEQTFDLLKQRPGLFARSLFANMLWFGADAPISAFREVVDKVPARLVFTLNMYAQTYFDKSVSNRLVTPLGSIAKSIAANRYLAIYSTEQLDVMKTQIEDLCNLSVQKRFAAIENSNKTIFIDELLFKIPVAIGDRSETVQDMPSALMGTRFAVEGDSVRLFMQWGKDLPAQHLDMDLSCHIAFANGKHNICSFSKLVTQGCKHSGDIRSIPEKVGTAEYIDLDINELDQIQVQYVTFTCNAFSRGDIVLDLIIGWMNSKHPMHISETTGVAYDPSCVQHQVRITQGMSKGLVFGVLDVAAREIIWLEMPFGGQVVGNLDKKNVEALLIKLNAKLSIGNLLLTKATAQGLELVETAEEADEVYTAQWAYNPAAVTQLFID